MGRICFWKEVHVVVRAAYDELISANVSNLEVGAFLAMVDQHDGSGDLLHGFEDESSCRLMYSAFITV